MHPNGLLLRRLFTALDVHDHPTMAECYAPAASFRDIAFDLKGKPQIHAMWQMICDAVTSARPSRWSTPTMSKAASPSSITTRSARPKFKVRNVIDARFRFENGLIVQHHDQCDAKAWAAMAFHGGVRGFLAGRFRFVRSRAAQAKLKAFMDGQAAHPAARAGGPEAALR